jgi:hypothetical protein
LSDHEGSVLWRHRRTVRPRGRHRKRPALAPGAGPRFRRRERRERRAGFGITAKICAELHNAGVDCITTGNHIWDQRDIISYIAQDKRLLRPLNFPPGTPGWGANQFETARGQKIVVMNVMCRLFMEPLDDPFRASTSRSPSIARALGPFHPGRRPWRGDQREAVGGSLTAMAAPRPYWAATATVPTAD